MHNGKIGHIICHTCCVVIIYMYLRNSVQSIEKKSKVEIKSDVAVNLSGKDLPSAGSLCKQK